MSETPAGTAMHRSTGRPVAIELSSRLLRSVLAASFLLLPPIGCDREAPPAEATTAAGSAAAWPLNATPLTHDEAIVVSGHPLASAVGAEILERGGTAADAAIAVGFALAAVLPEAGNLGGGGFLVYRSADGEVTTLDYREKAPLAAHHDMFLDENGELTEKSKSGLLASGVPGTVAGHWQMHQELGSLAWGDLVEPAIELARGHVMDATRHQHLAERADRLSRYEATKEAFLPGGAAPPIGEMWSQPDLAATLERIRDGGRDGFYRGETADLLVAEMERGGGMITHQDLESYEAVWRRPIHSEYRGYTVHSMPPPSSGGITLAMILNQLALYDSLPQFGSAALIHREAEAMRWAFLDRNQFLGDPDFVDMPIERLLSPAHAATLQARFDPERATPTPKGTAEMLEGDHTTHYSIVDAAGNAAAVTTTLNAWYGSLITVPGAGFLLNNEMDDFAAQPGKPNLFGLVQGEQNAVEPGKRMLSSMTPTIVEDPDGGLFMVLGCPGGSRIITSVMQTISNVVDHGMTLAEAVASPRVHHQALPDRLVYEPEGLAAEALETLSAMGYQLYGFENITLNTPDYSGEVNAIQRGESGWVGVADPRRAGGVSGY